jgi:hypothetical protein
MLSHMPGHPEIPMAEPLTCCVREYQKIQDKYQNIPHNYKKY